MSSDKQSKSNGFKIQQFGDCWFPEEASFHWATKLVVIILDNFLKEEADNPSFYLSPIKAY